MPNVPIQGVLLYKRLDRQEQRLPRSRDRVSTCRRQQGACHKHGRHKPDVDRLHWGALVFRQQYILEQLERISD